MFALYYAICVRVRTFSHVIALFTRVFAARAGQKTQKWVENEAFVGRGTRLAKNGPFYIVS